MISGFQAADFVGYPSPHTLSLKVFKTGILGLDFAVRLVQRKANGRGFMAGYCVKFPAEWPPGQETAGIACL